MRKVEIITAEQAAQLVKDNDTITSIGFVSRSSQNDGGWGPF